MSTTDLCKTPRARAVLDEAHIGDIRGALGTIRQHDIAPRRGWWTRLRTLLAILGPGLIVMAGDNDAGAFGTYSQAGQDYGTSLLWTLLLLVPVLYVNQEMVLRLGTVTGVGHARLILERFGRFWGAFSVIDLFLLNALTIVTEFIGISLALHYLGLPRELGVIASAAIIIAAAGTGDFRRFERFSLLLVFGSLLLIPVFIWVHPPIGEIAHGLAVPQLPADGKASEVILLIIAIVGTTVAPWQLFFQQSYVIDKRITPRFMRYERADLCIGIVLVIVGAVAIMAFTAATFAGRPEFGNFQDAGAVAAGLGKYVGHAAGIFFAVALIDASVIGAMAVSLSTAYAIGDVLSLRHSLHRKPKEAKAFYAVYGGLVTLAAALVLTPGTPLGLLTNAVQSIGRRVAAERDRLPAASVQRRGSARAVGQWTAAQCLHRRGHRRTGDAINHFDRVGSLSRHGREDAHCTPWRRDGVHPRDRSGVAGRPARGSAGLDRRFRANDLANAAARSIAGSTVDATCPDLAERPARLPRHRRRACALAHRRTCCLCRLSEASCAREKTAHAALQMPLHHET